MGSTKLSVENDLIHPIFIGNKSNIENCANDLKWDISKYEIIDEKDENNTAPIAAKFIVKTKSK